MTGIDAEVAKLLGYVTARPKFTTDNRAADTLSTWLHNHGMQVSTLAVGREHDGALTVGAVLRLTRGSVPKEVYGTVASGKGPTVGAALCDALMALREAVGPDVFRQLQATAGDQ